MRKNCTQQKHFTSDSNNFFFIEYKELNSWQFIQWALCYSFGNVGLGHQGAVEYIQSYYTQILDINRFPFVYMCCYHSC